MLDNIIIIKSAIGIIGWVAICYMVGRLFNWLINKRQAHWGWLPTYVYLLSGMLLSISAFAMFKTNGITILTLIPFLLLFVSKGLHQKFTFLEVKGFRKKAEPFFFLLISILIAYLYYLQGFAVDGDTIHYVWGDQEYYARVAENLSHLGIENMRVEYLYPERFTVEPFHYADLWSIALAYHFSFLKPIFGAVLVAAPFLMGLSALGLASLVQYFFIKERSTLVLYSLVAVGLVGGFVFLFPSFVFPGSVDVYARSMCHYTKLLWWASILPLFFIVVMNKSDELLLYLVFIVGFGYINVLPTLAMASYLWVLLISYKRGELLVRFIKMLSIAAGSALFMYALYAFYPSLSAVQRPVTGKAVFSIVSIISNLRTSVNIFVGGFFQFFVYLPPLLLLLVHFWIDQIKFKTSAVFNVVVYAIVVMVAALLVWALLFTTTMEAIQFFYNAFVVVAGMLSAIIYAFIFSTSKKVLIKVVSIFLFVFAMLGNIKYDINVKSIDRVERDALFSFVRQADNRTFAHYRDVKDYTADFFSSGTLTAMPYSILVYCLPRYENFSLNVPFSHLDSSNRAYPFQKNNVDWAPMSYFVKMEENKLLSQDQLMQKFMLQHKIGFLCLPIEVELPFALKIFTIDSLVTPKEGWKIYRCTYEGKDLKANY